MHEAQVKGVLTVGGLLFVFGWTSEIAQKLFYVDEIVELRHRVLARRGFLLGGDVALFRSLHLVDVPAPGPFLVCDAHVVHRVHLDLFGNLEFCLRILAFFSEKHFHLPFEVFVVGVVVRSLVSHIVSFFGDKWFRQLYLDSLILFVFVDGGSVAQLDLFCLPDCLALAQELNHLLSNFLRDPILVDPDVRYVELVALHGHGQIVC